jgi:hypothetical protein
MTVVDESSAKLGTSRELILELDADHSNVCKFEYLADDGYKVVVRHLKRLVEEALENNNDGLAIPSQ